MPELKLRTRVAHFGYGDTQFCGYSVREALVDRSGYWTSISLAIGGPLLSRDQEDILDGLSVASINADPRIWPLKLTRMIASHGSVVAGIAGSFIGLDGGYVGAPAIAGAAAMLVEFGEIEATGGAAAVERAVAERIDAGGRLMGFGVPNRERDERVLAAQGLIDRHGLARGRYWKLMETIEGVATSKKETLRLNIGSASAAIFLDMGFSVQQIGVLASLMLLNNMIANAVEGAEQRAPALLEFPRAQVQYVGPAARLSPRAVQT